MARQIFRQEALERLASPEQLDQLMPIASPRGWIALAGIGLLLLAAILWGFLGTLEMTVEGRGVLVRAGGLRPLHACCTGSVERLSVAAGDTVVQGQELLRMTPEESRQTNGRKTLTSPSSGRVLNLLVAEGSVVKEGEILMMVEDIDRPLQAVVYVPVVQGYEVEPGMEVRLQPAGRAAQDASFPVGHVTRAGKFPVTRAAMVRTLQSEEVVNSLAAEDAFLEVLVDFEESRTAKIYSGTPCHASIPVARWRPIALVLPGLGQKRGS